jgi:hypothetical protein
MFNPFPAEPRRMRWNTYLRLRQEEERALMAIKAKNHL